jgi:hypothetical protein
MIKAIETIYKGYRFRSRLEARWAVFFDGLGIQWEYEPEGFEKTLAYEANGIEKVTTYRWLPDFFLPHQSIWCEVKPDGRISINDAEKMAHILDCGSPIPDFDDSDYRNASEPKNVILLLGNIPPEKSFVEHPFIAHHKALVRRYTFFYSHYNHGFLCASGVHGYDVIDGYAESGEDVRKFFDTTPIIRYDDTEPDRNSAIYPVRQAYTKARQARFEHGENP